MIKEDYVSFEIAKLLQEKGFDWEGSPFYSEQDREEWSRNNNYNIPNPNYDASIPFDSEVFNVIAPHVSLQMAMKWLREVHKISIDVNSYYLHTYDGYAFGYRILSLDSHSIYHTSEYETYEEACEAAIKYCLENLI